MGRRGGGRSGGGITSDFRVAAAWCLLHFAASTATDDRLATRSYTPAATQLRASLLEGYDKIVPPSTARVAAYANASSAGTDVGGAVATWRRPTAPESASYWQAYRDRKAAQQKRSHRGGGKGGGKGKGAGGAGLLQETTTAAVTSLVGAGAASETASAVAVR